MPKNSFDTHNDVNSHVGDSHPTRFSGRSGLDHTERMARLTRLRRKDDYENYVAPKRWFMRKFLRWMRGK